MNEQSTREDILNILRMLSSSNNLTQRDLSSHLNISLGKANYLIKSLAKKGLLEMHNFASGDKKAKKIKYLLTKKGWEFKINLTYHFLKQKENEYITIKKEWENIKSNQSSQ